MFDSCGDHPLFETGAHRDDGADDDAIVVGRANILHERLVDFQDIDRKLTQVTQAGIAGTKIIDRQLHPHILKLLQDRRARFGIAHQHALGNFQLQAAWLQSSFIQYRVDAVNEIGTAKFQCRDIHGDRT